MRSQRKDEHVKYALKQKVTQNDFDKIVLMHQSLPSYDLDEIKLETSYLNHTFRLPIYINAMTGGSLKTQDINKRLAKLAQKHGLAMAVGSQHVALDDKAYEASFKIVRETYPEGFLLSNINPNASVEEAKRAIEMIDANALQIHINPAQELAMDEGDRTFKHWLSNIEAIVKAVKVPVVIKEVGNGLSQETVQKLINVGVKHVDVSGRGGTNFIWIENERSEKQRYTYLEDWGLSTVEALVDNQVHLKDVEIFASGGIRSPLDVIKALVLGARAVGMSSLFLNAVENNTEQEIDLFIEDLKKIMLLVDINNVDNLKTIRYKISDL